MPENPSPVPPDDPCYRMVATYHDYVGSRIDAFLHAERYQKFAANFEPLTQCCGELRAKVDRLRPDNPDSEALQTFTIPTEVFDRQSACGQHPYFQNPAGGGLSPANNWFREQEQSRSDFWLQQYTDLSEELHGCCVQHLSQCLLKGAEARSCLEALLPGPPPASVPEAVVPAVPPPVPPAETQAATLFQRGGTISWESSSRSRCRPGCGFSSFCCSLGGWAGCSGTSATGFMRMPRQRCLSGSASPSRSR